MKRAMSFLLGAMLGGFVGATLAILLAPSSGEELRAQLQAKVQQIQAELQSAAAARRAELEAQLASLRSPQSGTGE